MIFWVCSGMGQVLGPLGCSMPDNPLVYHIVYIFIPYSHRMVGSCWFLNIPYYYTHGCRKCLLSLLWRVKHPKNGFGPHEIAIWPSHKWAQLGINAEAQEQEVRQDREKALTFLEPWWQVDSGTVFSSCRKMCPFFVPSKRCVWTTKGDQRGGTTQFKLGATDTNWVSAKIEKV